MGMVLDGTGHSTRSNVRSKHYVGYIGKHCIYFIAYLILWNQIRHTNRYWDSYCCSWLTYYEGMNDEEEIILCAKAAGANIDVAQFVEAFLIENTRPDMTMQQKLDRSNDQRDRAVLICDAMMAWETPADARKTSKDLSQLKKEINE